MFRHLPFSKAVSIFLKKSLMNRVREYISEGREVHVIKLYITVLIRFLNNLKYE